MKRSVYYIATSFILVFLLFLSFLPVFYAVAEEENLLPDGGFDNVSVYTSGVILKGRYMGAGWRFSDDCEIEILDSSQENYGIYNSGKGNSVSAVSRIKDGNYQLPAGNYRAGFLFATANTVQSATVCVSLVNVETGEETASEPVSVGAVTEFTPLEFDITVSLTAVYEFKVTATKVTATKFYAHFDDFYLYAAKEPNETVADATDIGTEVGAALRITGNAGLRFTGRIRKAFFSGYESVYGDVEAGMIIVPTDYIDDCEFTAYALESAGIPKQICVVNEMRSENCVIGDAEEEYYLFTCAIVDIQPFNLDRDFSARTFLRYKVDDEYVYVYGEYSEEDHSRSVFGVAQRAAEEPYIYSDAANAVIEYYANSVSVAVADFSERSGNSFRFEYIATKGCFVPDYDRSAFTVGNVSVAVDGVEADISSGYLMLDGDCTVTITLDVTSGEAEEFSLRAKIYKTER